MFIGYSFKRFVGFLTVLLLLFVSGILLMPEPVQGVHVLMVSLTVVLMLFVAVILFMPKYVSGVHAFMVSLTAMLLMLVSVILFMPEPVSGAYVASVSGIKQDSATTTSVTISWNKSMNATSYRVYYAENGSNVPYSYAGETESCSFEINGLKDSVQYRVQVYPYKGEQQGMYGLFQNACTLPDKPIGLKQTNWWYFIGVLDVGWTHQSGVDGYDVQFINNKGKVVKTQTEAYSRATYNKAKDQVYVVKLRSYKTLNGKKYTSKWISINCIPQAKVLKVSLKDKKVNISWKKVSGATGYKVYMSTKKNKGYKLVKTVKKNVNKCTITKLSGKKLSKNKNYYVYVKTICNKKGRKGTSSNTYYWNVKTGKYEYI